MHFCGNHGDPIYHPKLFELVEFLKAHNVVIEITTNGSHRKLSWWSDLLKILDERDALYFSVDGLKDTLSLYRHGADWESVLAAMKLSAEAPVKSIWKYIVFRHNENQIEEARNLASELGFDQFTLVKSSSWESPLDPMLPSWEYVEESKRVELKRELEEIQKKKPQANVGPFNRLPVKAPADEIFERLKSVSTAVERVYPRCHTEHHYLSASAQYAPCCWMDVSHFKRGNPFLRPEFQRPTSFDQIQAAIARENLLARIESAEFTACRIHCKEPCHQYHGHEFTDELR